MNERKLVRTFRHRFQLRTVDSAGLCRALKELGYTVVEFNGLCDTENVAELLDALELQERARRCRGFTYRDDSFRLVFLHQDLTELEKTVVLAHEAGHICCGHMDRSRVLGEDVLQEREANEFAHYLLRDPTGKGRRRLLAAALCALLILSCTLGGLLWKGQHDRAVYTDHFYRTAAGEKYHLRECMYLRDRKDVYRLTRKEFDSGEFEPCDACLPDVHETLDEN